MIQIQPGDLYVGAKLDWPVYDENKRLLLKKGAVIGSPRQLDSLLLRGIYRADAPDREPREKNEIKDNATAFDRLDGLIRRIPGLLYNLTEAKPHAADRVVKFAEELHGLFKEAPNSLIGAVHLTHEYDYSQVHPVHVAILCAMMAGKLGYDEDRLHSLVAAALTQNLGMWRLQETLQKQEGALSDGQRQAITAHPARSVQVLRRAGVEDSRWLNAVMQHHERSDGKGYPRGLSSEQICQEAKLISLGDRYAAMISSRAYRDALESKTALKDFFLQKGAICDEALTMSFIQEIGVYPPGTFVQLNNGEVGIVIKRGKTGIQPVVAAYVAPRGAPYPRPFRRDCAQGTYQIRGTTKPDVKIPINLGTIWAA